MLRARYILPLVLPLLLIFVPTVAYLIDVRSGTERGSEGVSIMKDEMKAKRAPGGRRSSYFR
jgi:hypothetical protein